MAVSILFSVPETDPMRKGLIAYNIAIQRGPLGSVLLLISICKTK